MVFIPKGRKIRWKSQRKTAMGYNGGIKCRPTPFSFSCPEDRIVCVIAETAVTSKKNPVRGMDPFPSPPRILQSLRSFRMTMPGQAPAYEGSCSFPGPEDRIVCVTAETAVTRDRFHTVSDHQNEVKKQPPKRYSERLKGFFPDIHCAGCTARTNRTAGRLLYPERPERLSTLPTCQFTMTDTPGQSLRIPGNPVSRGRIILTQ